MTRKFILLAIATILLIAGVFWAWQWWHEGRFWESTDNAYTRSDVAVVTTWVPGIVDKVYVEDNQVVAANDILFSQQKASYRAQVERAHAQVAQELSIGETLKTKVTRQDAIIAASAAGVKSAATQLERANLDMKRAQVLRDKKLDNRQAYDHAVTDLASAEADLARARASLETARAEIAVIRAKEAEAVASHQRAEAELRVAEINLELTDVRAARAGRVGNKHVEPGEYVVAGARKMALVGIDDVWVIANFKETQLTEVVPGQRALVNVDAFPDQPIKGVVDSLSPASGAEFSLLPPDNATGNFTKIVQRVPVKILLDKDSPIVNKLRAGMSVVAKVDTRAPSAAADSRTHAVSTAK
ncbi:MAG: HlyD family secretion protein [Porticoccaceae bacterium]